jgi:hypothetical protein
VGINIFTEAAMKNLSSSYLFKSQADLFKSQTYHAKPKGYLLEMDVDDPKSALTQGIYHKVEDWVALELTAEQMLSDEVNVVSTYVAGDARQMWEAIKDSLLPYELAAGQILLRAADPTQVEWSQGHWWDKAALS